MSSLFETDPQGERTRSPPESAEGDRAGHPESPSGEPIGITVIIPTYNERENITQVISQCLKHLPSPRFEPEVLVVDDDSRDYTWQYPMRLFGHDPRVRVIRRQADDKGLAQSVTDGFEAATHEYCAVIDADLQHPPEKLAELAAALDDGADVAIGSRHAAGGGQNYSWKRKLVSKGAILTAKVAVPGVRRISDPLAGFFAIRREVVEGVDLNPKGYKILLEVLTKGRYETTSEVPYVFQRRERGESNLTLKEYQDFLEHVGKLAIVDRGADRYVDPHRAVRVSEFALVGATGTLVNMAVFGGLALVGKVFYLAAGVVAFLVAVNWNFAGNWLLTFDRPAENIPRQYLRFHAVSVTGFVAYSVTLTAFAQTGIHLLVSNALAILAGAAFNFLGSESVVFPTDDSDEVTAEQATPPKAARGD